jgi:uncharacterized membrane protein
VSWGIVFRVRQWAKGSLWLLPFIGLVAGIGIAQLAIGLEPAVTMPAGWQYSADTATSVLSATIGAEAALTGFVVTVTVLGVQMATGTFSARYMRLWYRDGMLKSLLAMLLGTMTFSFVVIGHVETDSVPNLGVTLAGMAVAMGLLLFVLYLDRFLHRMRPVAVAALVAAEARYAFQAWVEEASRPDTSFLAGGSFAPPTTRPAFVLRATHAGVMQAVDTAGLARFARAHECLIVFRHAVGDFVPVGASILEVHGAEPPVAAGRRLASMVALGVERTVEQDPAFAIRIMVDIAVMALSAAVNAPATAVQVLDHLAETLRLIGTTPLERAEAGTEQLTSGVIMRVRGWPDFLSLGVTEIREYGGGSIQVVRRLRALLLELGELVLPEHRAAVEEELRRLDETVAANFAGSVDLDRARIADARGSGGRAGPPEEPDPLARSLSRSRPLLPAS